MDEKEEKKISKYSSGINIIMRLDILWKDAHNHSRNGLFAKWNADLDRIWCELARDLDDDEFKEKKKEFDKFDEDLKKLKGFEDNALSGFEKLSKEQIEKRDKQYRILMDKELFLRRLENYVGKGTTWDEESEYDFD